MPMLATGRAVGIAEEPQLVELASERIVGQQTAYQRLPKVEQQLDGLGALKKANRAGQHAQHASFGAARCQRRRRRLGIETAIARSIIGLEYSDLTFKAEDATMHYRLILKNRGIIEQIARWEVVGAVENDVVIGDDPPDVGFVQALQVSNHIDVGIERVDGLTGGFGLVLPNALGVVQDLALQVAIIDDIGIDNAKRAHARSGKIIGRRRSQTASADQQDSRVEQLKLSLLAHFRNEQVTAIPSGLRIRHHTRFGEPVTAILPLPKAAGHRYHILIAHLLQGAASDERAHTARTI